MPRFITQAPKPKIADDIFPDYIVAKPSTRAKRLALRLDTKKRVFNLVIPRGTSLRRAHAFALENEGWMQKRLNELPALVLFTHGTKLTLWGEEYEIEINYSDTLKKTNMSLNKNKFIVSTNKEKPHSRIVRFLKQEAKEKLSALSQEKAVQIGKTVKSVTVRDTKSRWGSCSADGNLSYSWRLIFAPYASMDYVVAHEVAHLEHLNHGKDFWALCERLCADYKNGKGWMRKHAHELMKYQ